MARTALTMSLALAGCAPVSPPPVAAAPPPFSSVENDVRQASDTTRGGRLVPGSRPSSRSHDLPGASTLWTFVPYEFDADRSRLPIPDEAPFFDERGPVKAEAIPPGSDVVVFLREPAADAARPNVTGVRVLDEGEARAIRAQYRPTQRARR